MKKRVLIDSEDIGLNDFFLRRKSKLCPTIKLIFLVFRTFQKFSYLLTRQKDGKLFLKSH
jgi:hypothetical protein